MYLFSILESYAIYIDTYYFETNYTITCFFNDVTPILSNSYF